MRAGAIEDYTYMWWDVRPHPNLGTVEARIFDQQTRVEHTIALAALTVCARPPPLRQYDDEEPLVEYPTELVDDNKVRAALRGMEGELVDFRAGPAGSGHRDGPARAGRGQRGRPGAGLRARAGGDRGPAAGGHRRPPPARDLGGRRPRTSRRWSRETASRPDPASDRAAVRRRRARMLGARGVVAAGAERRLQEVRLRSEPVRDRCPYCGTRLRKRAPKLERHGDELTRPGDPPRTAPPACRRAPGAPRPGRLRLRRSDGRG